MSRSSRRQGGPGRGDPRHARSIDLRPTRLLLGAGALALAFAIGAGVASGGTHAAAAAPAAPALAADDATAAASALGFGDDTSLVAAAGVDGTLDASERRGPEGRRHPPGDHRPHPAGRDHGHDRGRRKDAALRARQLQRGLVHERDGHAQGPHDRRLRPRRHHHGPQRRQGQGDRRHQDDRPRHRHRASRTPTAPTPRSSSGSRRPSNSPGASGATSATSRPPAYHDGDVPARPDLALGRRHLPFTRRRCIPGREPPA